MRKKVSIVITLAMVTFIAGCDKGDDETPGIGVMINGVTWATSNIGESGSFVARPEDAGELYDFDAAQTVCPAGWHTPTIAEFDKLIASGYEWITINDVGGVRFGSGNNTVFFPYAGFRIKPDDEEIFYETGGRYWSSIAFNDTQASAMLFDLRPPGLEGVTMIVVHENGVSYLYKANKFSVRCVKE